jgi:hypothetical protein
VVDHASLERSSATAVDVGSPCGGVKTRGRDADGEGLDRPHYTQEAMERVPEAACRYNNMEKSINRDIRMLGAWVPQVDDSIKGIQKKLDTIGNRLTTL